MCTNLTLEEALILEGAKEQVKMLTKRACSLTKGEVEKIFSGHESGQNLSRIDLESLSRLVKYRVENGQTVLPFEKIKVDGIQAVW